MSWINKIIGKYKLELLLGEGASGAVYQARHMSLNKIVAIKILHPSLLVGEKGDKVAKRFLREARTAAELNHANIVQVFDIEEQDGVNYLVMELVDGLSLQQMIQDKIQISYPRLLELIRGIVRGLRAAHKKYYTPGHKTWKYTYIQ